MSDVERMLPLYEAKMIHQFDHRWATYERDGSVRDVTLEEKQDPDFLAMPRYWVRESVVRDRLEGRWDRDWLLGWRDICRSTDERTMIAAIDGLDASPEGGTLLALPEDDYSAPLILAVFNSFAFDFVARQKIGGTHLKYFTVRQLPIPAPSTFRGVAPWDRRATLGAWLIARVVPLVADARDMIAFASDFGLDLSEDAWDPDSRRQRRAEVDAAIFQIYGVSRDDVDYIMETFSILKRRNEDENGEYRVKRMILEVYDQMAESVRTGTPFESPLGPKEHS